MFENSEVKAETKWFRGVAAEIPSELVQDVELGGLAFSAKLDDSVVVYWRLRRGNWCKRVRSLDRSGNVFNLPPTETKLNMRTVHGVLSLATLLELGLMGQLQLEDKDFTIVPTQNALAARPNLSAEEWASFIENWRAACTLLFNASQGPDDLSRPNLRTLRIVAGQFWETLFKSNPKLFSRFAPTIF